MTKPKVHYETSHHVATITLDDPPVFNALDYEGYDRLSRAFRDADSDDAVRAVVLTGVDPGFCAGDNVKKLQGEQGKELARRLRDGTLELPSVPLRECRKPVIAALNGPAVGYGMDIALLADIRIASTRASLASAFVKRAIIASSDCFDVLPRLVGHGAAAEIVLTGAKVDAAEALRIGLVNRVVEHENLLEEAATLARALADNPPLAVIAAKRALGLAAAGDHGELGRYVRNTLTELLQSDDHRESVAAFLAKRTPEFQGR